MPAERARARNRPPPLSQQPPDDTHCFRTRMSRVVSRASAQWREDFPLLFPGLGSDEAQHLIPRQLRTIVAAKRGLGQTVWPKPIGFQLLKFSRKSRISPPLFRQ